MITVKAFVLKRQAQQRFMKTFAWK